MRENAWEGGMNITYQRKKCSYIKYLRMRLKTTTILYFVGNIAFLSYVRV